MERLSMMRSFVAIVSVGGFLVGCGSPPQADVSADEEKMFKNPGPVDRSKIPADAFKPKGPSFIGEPSKGSGAGSAPPPAASGG